MSYRGLAIAAALLAVGCEGLLGVDNLRIVAGDAGTGSDDKDAETASVDADAASDGSGRKSAAPDASSEAASDAEAGPPCTMDLSNVGTGDFHISFAITTEATGLTLALVNQQTVCDQSSWAITLNSEGGIVATTGDVSVEAGDSVNDGTPHQVVVERVNGNLSYLDNGTLRSSIVSDSFAFAVLPPLVVGTSTCPGTAPLAGLGTVTDLCVATR